MLKTFYTAFQQKDYAAMQACYHPEASFSDPVFQNLDAKQVRAMWHMLCERGKDLQLKFDVLSESQVFWEADYSFSKSGRMVNNKINATFEFKDDLIYVHKDTFDLWKWSGMALGSVGNLLGWTPFFKAKIRKTAMSGLHKFIHTHPDYQ